MESRHYTTGFVDERFIFELEDEYIIDLNLHKSNLRSIEFNCCVCFNFLIKPIECSKCEKRICLKCHKNIWESRIKECPFCRDKNEFKNVSLTFKKILGMFNITCPKLCGSIINYENYEKHLKECKGFNKHDREAQKLVLLIESMKKEKEDLKKELYELDEKSKNFMELYNYEKIQDENIISELVKENERLNRDISQKCFENRELRSKIKKIDDFISLIFRIIFIFIINQFINIRWK